MLFNALEIPCRIAVVGGGGIALGVRNVEIQIVHRRRDPDGGSAQPFDVRHFLLNSCKITTPIKSPVGLGRIEKTRALWRIVVAGIAIKEAIGDDLVDD